MNRINKLILALSCAVALGPLAHAATPTLGDYVEGPTGNTKAQIGVGVVTAEGALIGATNPLPVSGTFSATLGGFQPTAGQSASLSVTTTSSDVALPTGASVSVTNTGATDAAVRMTVGAGTAVTTDLVLKAGSTAGFAVGTNTHISAITASGSTTLRIQGGSGLVTGYGAGGGSGGAVTVTSGTITVSNLPTTVDTNSGAAGASTLRVVQATGATTAATQATAANLNATVVGTGTFAVQAAQSGAFNITNVSGTVSLPTGAATAAKQPALGTAGASSADVLSVQGISSGTAMPVSGTFWQATQPVSGTFWQATQPVSGTFWQATQPVSGTVSITANSAVNEAQINGVTPLMGNGVTGTGSQRVTIASDNTAFSVNANAGTNLNTSALATSANLTSGTQKTQIVDGSGNVIASTSNNLNVQCANCSGSGVSTADEASMTFGTSLFAGAGGVYQTTATSNALTTGQQGMFQVTANRALFSNLRNAAGTEVGTSTTPLQVSLANTATNATAVKTDSSATTQPVSGTFWQATQPVSGTVTANAGTGTMAVSGTFWQATQPVSGTVSITANSAVNEAQINGVTPLMGNGVTGTGSQRVTIASDNTAFTVNAAESGAWNITNVSGTISLPTGASTAAKQPALGTAGTPSADVLTVQGATSMTALKTDSSATTQPVSAASLPLPTGAATETTLAKLAVAQASTTSGQSGTLTLGAVTTAAPSYTTAQSNALSLTTAGALRTDASGTTQPVSGTVSITANSAVNTAQVNGVTTLTGTGAVGTGAQRIAVGTDTATIAGSAPSIVLNTSDAATSTTGSAVPAKATYIGANSAGNLVGLIQADSSASVSISTATTTQIVALASSKKIYVTAYSLIAGGTGNVTLEYGTGSTCGTGTTVLTGALPLVANSGIAAGSGLGPVLVIPASNALCILTSAGVQISGSVAYTQF